MKKFLFMAALMITAALSLSSCGDDEPNEKVTATATYSLSLSQDLLDACNVFITYKAENGRNVKDKIATTWWTQSITSDKFPAEFGVKFEFSPKALAELTKDKYNLTSELNMNIKTSKGANYTNSFTIINSPDVSKDKVVSTLEKKNGTSVGFKVSKDGIPTQNNNLDYD